MEISSNFTIGSVDQIVSKKGTSNSDMSMDDFLKILSASLENPSMSSEEGGNGSTDYMSQMIQFSTMDQLQSLTESLNTTMMMTQQQQALAMIGKKVTVTDDNKIVSGVVEKVSFSNGYATIFMDGKEYYLSNIQEVGE